MPKLPVLLPQGRRRRPSHEDSVVFAVYAPFGTDSKLATYPGDVTRLIEQQPLVGYLKAVADEGVNVSALIDLVGDDTYLVEIPAWRSHKMSICSAWKQSMSAPQALAGFLRRTHARFPCSALVLSLEGHGAGFLPDLAFERLTSDKTNTSVIDNKPVDWVIKADGVYPVEPGGDGSPLLGVSPSPELPTHSPEGLPISLPMSTWGLAEALTLAAKAKVPRPAVIHFNNCFNMSVELLHTIRKMADYATGYANYNFFTAGESYPLVFRQLRIAGAATAEQLAKWFAAGNHTILHAKRNHPTIGATIALGKLDEVKRALDELAKALVSVLDALPVLNRRTQPDWIRINNAVLAAQHYDTMPGFELKSPDQLTDLASFALQLQKQFAPGHAVNRQAGILLGLINKIWQYGEIDRPHVDESQVWSFVDRQLGMNILLPDPAVEGVWDWRSPYYMSGVVNPDKPPPHAHQIEFLADGPGNARQPWVKFVAAYHDVLPRPKKVLARVRAPSFPRLDLKFKPLRPPIYRLEDDDGALLPLKPQQTTPGKPPTTAAKPRRRPRK